MQSSPSRIEEYFVFTAIAITLVFPPIFIECFPLSSCSMFARPYERIYRYALWDGEGHKLNNDIYGLRSNVNWYLEYTYPVKYPLNVVSPPSMAPNIDRLTNHVREVALRNQAAFPLRLRVDCIGDIDGNSIGLVSRNEWLLERQGLVPVSRN